MRRSSERARKPEKRKKFKTYDGTKKIFNLAYEALSWRAHPVECIGSTVERYFFFDPTRIVLGGIQANSYHDLVRLRMRVVF